MKHGLLDREPTHKLEFVEGLRSEDGRGPNEVRLSKSLLQLEGRLHHRCIESQCRRNQCALGEHNKKQ
jgi:hypothetical protein